VVSEIRLVEVTKTFDKKKTIMRDLSLTVAGGSFTVLVGPSGCGKTTILRMIAGLEEATSGRILIDGKDVTGLEPGERGIAMVFQNYAIYPHMSVGENVEFGLRNAGIPRGERRRLVEYTLGLVGLGEYTGVKPSKLSGGQRQRVALARAISKRPRVFLMDEPLSNLDAQLRDQMRTELIELHRKLEATFVYVTHDQIEAMTMGERIVIMDEGTIRQAGTPREVYREPRDVFVARFIGNPGMNVLACAGGGYWGFRPHDARLAGFPGQEGLVLPGVVLTREVLGAETLYCIDTAHGKVMVKSPDDGGDFGQSLRIHVPKAAIHFFDARRERVLEPERCASWFRGLAVAP
jgi:sn-glycerol 3-phosphate transport system ATP-binding protein